MIAVFVVAVVAPTYAKAAYIEGTKAATKAAETIMKRFVAALMN